MKRVRYGLIAATLLGLLLTGCSNFGLVFGTPTVSVSSPVGEQTSVEEIKDANGNVIGLRYKTDFSIILYVLPGSPGGRIFLRSGSSDVYGFTIESCPVETTNSCPNEFRVSLSNDLAPQQKIQITSYVAQSLNDTTQKENALNYPVYVYVNP